jgi:hypothetical protein
MEDGWQNIVHEPQQGHEKFNPPRKIQMLIIKLFFAKLYASSHIDLTYNILQSQTNIW